MVKKNITFLSLFFPLFLFSADSDTSHFKDSLHYKYIENIVLVGNASYKDMLQLPEIVGTDIFAGKKNNLLIVDKIQANLLNNTMRQIMAKVAGIHIWESDGSGIQIGVATRGLSPNRTIEFNVRQNGNEIAADPISYAEAYYNPQFQGVQKMQIVRGAGALQYGTQFGGMINYIMKNGYDILKPFEFETQQSIGSFNLYNTFNAFGGTIGNFHYYAFMDYRKSDGWRQNSQYDIKNYFITASYQLTKKIKVGLEYTQQQMLSQQPGGLSDSLFYNNSQQSLRSRNWFDLQWHIIAANVQWKYGNDNLFTLNAYYLNGLRNSIGYQIGDITIADTINKNTLQYNLRTIEMQAYDNIGIELRNRTNVNVNNNFKTIFSFGVKYFKGISPLKTSNNGSATTAIDFTITDKNIANNYHRNTNNIAVFFENAFFIGKHFIVTPGARYEYIQTNVSGSQSGNALANTKPERNIFLLGISAEYHLPFNTELYANYTEAFKPFWYGNISTLNTNKIDPNLKDAKGYNIDLGYRGNINNYLNFDMTTFYLKYNNRFGTLTQADKSTLATNVGATTHYGLETFAEINIMALFNKHTSFSFNTFFSYSYVNAHYDDFLTSDGKNLKGNKVQDAPENILRYGLQGGYKTFVASVQYSFVDESFSDANNTISANNKGTIGLIPAYHIFDFNLSYKFLNHFSLKGGINNILSRNYFTRRAASIPGSGIMPADAQSFYMTLGVKL